MIRYTFIHDTVYIFIYDTVYIVNDTIYITWYDMYARTGYSRYMYMYRFFIGLAVVITIITEDGDLFQVESCRGVMRISILIISILLISDFHTEFGSDLLAD